MSRRHLLTLAELALVTVAMASSLGLLAHTADVDHTQWAEAGFVGAVAGLILLAPTTLALLLHAAWLGAPSALRAVRAGRERLTDWRQWRGIQRAAEPVWQPEQAVQGTMAVRPRHAAGGAR